jgi:stage IV sporulation protein FB
VLIAEPPRTPWDIDFPVLGFPVRIHPLFWLVGFLLGYNITDPQQRGIQLFMWFVAFFGSILIHELGHALMIRRFGRRAYIVLYMMGGLAIEGRPRDSSFGSPWSFDSYTDFQPRQRTPNEQILISAAGPGIQFLLFGLVVAAIYATRGSVEVVFAGGLPQFIPLLGGELGAKPNIGFLVFLLLQINFLWPLINLLPVLPLDGGQIALQVFMQHDPWGGTRRALWLSVIVGGAVGVIGLVTQQLYTAMLFASLAASSYMTLQQLGGGSHRPW